MHRLKIIAAVVAVSLTGCTALRPSDDYIRGDRGTFDAVAPIVRKLADDDPANDPDLTGVNGRAIILAVDLWETRLTDAEAKMAEGK